MADAAETLVKAINVGGPAVHGRHRSRPHQGRKQHGQHSADIVGASDDPLYNTAIGLRGLSAP